MKARIYEEVDVTDWLRGQVRAGCTQLNLQSHTFNVERPVCEWILSAETDVPRLTEEIERLVASERARSRGVLVLGLFSFRPERWTPLEMALFVEEAFH
jgi:hypothetical protein